MRTVLTSEEDQANGMIYHVLIQSLNQYARELEFNWMWWDINVCLKSLDWPNLISFDYKIMFEITFKSWKSKKLSPLLSYQF